MASWLPSSTGQSVFLDRPSLRPGCGSRFSDFSFDLQVQKSKHPRQLAGPSCNVLETITKPGSIHATRMYVVVPPLPPWSDWWKHWDSSIIERKLLGRSIQKPYTCIQIIQRHIQAYTQSCIYVYMYIYIYTYSRTYVSFSLYLRNTCNQIDKQYICIYTHYVYLHMYMCVRMYARLCIYTSIYIHIYIYMYAHRYMFVCAQACL